MSWMDSWSRPAKSQATPAPYYAIPGGEATPYCHSCGRVIGRRRTSKETGAEVKYCSSGCRAHRPGRVERRIEEVWARFLQGADGATGEGPAAGGTKKQKKLKGDSRILVPCSAVEEYMFGAERKSTEESRQDADDERTSLNTETTAEQSKENQHVQTDEDSIDILLGDDGASIREPGYVDGDVLARMSVRSGTRIRPAQSVSEVNGSVGGEKGRAERAEETDEMVEKRRLGQRRAKEREMVRCAARRGIVFGFVVGDGGDGGGTRKKCEAVMAGKVVEPSFAKGDWSIRWREEVS